VDAGSDPRDPNSTPNNIPTLTGPAAAILVVVILVIGGWQARKRWPKRTRVGLLVLAAGGACLIAPDRLRSQGGPSERILYIHTDHLGTPLLLTDANQQVVWRATAEPFGRTAPSVNQVVFNLRFPGQYEDPETGLQYNNARHLDPVTGRYMQPDPVGQSADANLYPYVLGDPVNLVDPYGLAWSDFGRGMAEGLVVGGAFGVAAEIVGTNPYGRGALVVVGFVGLAYSAPDVYRLLTDPCATEAERDAFLGQVVGGVIGGGLAFRGVGALRARGIPELGPAELARIPVGRRHGIGTTGPDAAGLQTPQHINAPYQRVQNMPGSVGGRGFSGHAFDQMRNRGLVPSVAENTIQTGQKLPGSTSGTTVFFDPVNNVKVITNQAGRVITVE